MGSWKCNKVNGDYVKSAEGSIIVENELMISFQESVS